MLMHRGKGPEKHESNLRAARAGTWRNYVLSNMFALQANLREQGSSLCFLRSHCTTSEQGQVRRCTLAAKTFASPTFPEIGPPDSSSGTDVLLLHSLICGFNHPTPAPTTTIKPPAKVREIAMKRIKAYFLTSGKHMYLPDPSTNTRACRVYRHVRNKRYS
ncbi:hypothetical protein BD413DRAFT_192045 [Trametes elegans]|nr:hypothetical protein BD413DRAFT_192045 [Trametes elegans]